MVAKGLGGQRAEPEVGLRTEGVVALESLRRVPGGLEARFVNYSDQSVPLRVATEGTWVVTDLIGAVSSDPVDPFSLEVGPGQIVTLRRKS